MNDSGFSVGELIIMGFNGKSLSSETLQTIQHEGITQIILFAQNYESKEQLIALTDELQSYSTSSPFILSVDQEGGRVQRFRNGFTLLPPAKAIGDKNSANFAFEISQIQAKELFAAGIQLNYAPVCDINTNPVNPVIGDRAYGDHEEVVTKMASASVRGHLTQNVEVCLKHFPGHGDTHLDSHLALPSVDTPLDVLRKREWIPFHRAMKSGANFVMSAHIMLSHLDSKLPGTFSKTFLQKFLRQELMYQGVIVSDDMEMGAVVDNFGREEAPVLALQAGCDVLCYRSEEQAKIAIDAIKKAIIDKKLSEPQLLESVKRVRKVREKIKLAKDELTLATRLQTIGHPEHQEFLRQNLKQEI